MKPVNIFITALSRLITTLLCILIIGCSNSSDDGINSHNGRAVKGVISNGIISAHLAHNNTFITQTRSDDAGFFSLDLSQIADDSLILLTLSVDSESRMLCDLVEGCIERASGQTIAFGEKVKPPQYFQLLGVTTKNAKTAPSLTPLSHIIVKTSQALPQGINNQNIESAKQWLKERFNLEDDPLSIPPIDLTTEIEQSEETLKHAILGAALYEQATSPEWLDTALMLDELPITEILYTASNLANQLSNTPKMLSASSETYPSSLRNIANDIQDLAESTDSSTLQIQHHPQSMSVMESQSFSLNVLASGGEGELSYQWQKDGIDIFGATASIYYIQSAQLNNSGQYSVVVSDDLSQINSLAASISVEESILPVSIDQHPQSNSVIEGENIILSVVASGEEPLSYQWQKGGSIIPGATSSTLHINESALQDAGSYRVYISNSISEVYSEFANITVGELLLPPTITPPPSDVEALSIVSQPQAITARESESFTLQITANGGSGNYSYQWQKDGTAIQGAISRDYTVSSAQTLDSGLYSVIVSSENESIQSSNARVSIEALIHDPIITQQPTAGQVNEGETISLNVVASGSGTLTYQWSKNDTVLSDATSSTLIIGTSTLNDAGRYRVRISNSESHIFSDYADIQVNERLGSSNTSPPEEAPVIPAIQIHAHPQSKSLFDAQSFSLSVTASGGTGSFTYQWKKDGENLLGETSSTYYVSRAKLEDSGIYNVVISSGDEQLESLEALVQVEQEVLPVSITQQPTANTVNEGEAIYLNVVASGSEPIYYQWQKGGSIVPGATSSSLSINPSSIDDTGSYRVAVSNSRSQVYSNFVEVLVNERIEPLRIIYHPNSATVIEQSEVTFHVNAAGGGFLAYQWRKDGTAINGAYSSSLSIDSASLDDAGAYDVIISNSQGAITSSIATLEVIALVSPITIEQEPQAQSLFVGESINLSVQASGSSDLAYQWLFNDQNIEGENSASLVINNVSTNDAGSYSVVISGSAGEASVRSQDVAVSVQEVQPSFHSIEFSWETPQRREDGSTLNPQDIVSYVIEYGYSSSSLDQTLYVNADNSNTYTLDNLQSSTIYARIAAIDSDGIQSRYSEVVVINIP